jgi:hypothetical protein
MPKEMPSGPKTIDTLNSEQRNFLIQELKLLNEEQKLCFYLFLTHPEDAVTADKAYITRAIASRLQVSQVTVQGRISGALRKLALPQTGLNKFRPLNQQNKEITLKNQLLAASLTPEFLVNDCGYSQDI